jgi:hypothetical protein
MLGVCKMMDAALSQAITPRAVVLVYWECGKVEIA